MQLRGNAHVKTAFVGLLRCNALFAAKLKIFVDGCMEVFEQQSDEYKESVLPASVTARVSVEAGIEMGWAKYIGAGGRSVSIEHYGASASAAKCFEEFGFTVANVVAAAKDALS